MNEPAANKGRRMTVREAAEKLGCNPETVKNHIRELWPELMINGVTTYLTEMQATVILEKMKQGLAYAHHVTGGNVATYNSGIAGIETSQSRVFRVQMLYKQIEAELEAEISELKAKAEEDRPKAALHDLAMQSKDVMSVNDAAKVLKLGYGNITLFRKLRSMEILMPGNVPYQKYIAAGYFAVDESPLLIGDSIQIKKVTKVTQKGIKWLSGMLEKQEAV